MDAIIIRPMAEYARQVPHIAVWFYTEWGAIYGKQTQAEVQRRIESWLTVGEIPTAFVAVAGDRVIGTVALKEHEMPEFPETPWLAGLFVVPQLRGRGIGTVLVEAGEREALSLGVQQLFLYTPEAHQFYSRLGWLVMERRLLASGPVYVMSKLLTAAGLPCGGPEASTS